jgi:hypothetical protein
MGLPQPIEPEPDDTPESPSGRADWLVGADEGLEAELARKARESMALQRPTLLRPGAAESPAAVPAPAPPPAVLPLTGPEPTAAPDAPRKVFGRVDADAAESDVQRGTMTPMTWDAGANSVPTLRRDRPAPPAALPQTERDFPMDDAEERARQRAERFAEFEAVAEQLQRGHQVVTPNQFDIAPPRLPWWARAVDMLRSDRRVQALVLLVALVAGGIAAWPRDGGTASIAELKAHAERYDGRQVTVKGRVGEVFAVGGGHAFNLHQGRDTLVVFTRVRVPRTRDQVSVNGALSTGFLDGQARLALFESNTPPAKR